MAPASESASEIVAEIWEVGATEDVVQAMIEKLVDPRLPLRVSASGPPSMDSQKSVAKQIHAVVLLYNYYHRKQKPELRFLDFVSFCKLVVELRPPLSSFMKSMSTSISTELNSSKDQLSVTEKTIKNACNVAGALDASKDEPNIEMWRISKVAVLLVDSKKENCYLEFGLVTEGVWSLIEKSTTVFELNPEVSAEGITENKRKRNSQIASTVDNFVQLGYDAVKDVTGFGSSDLVVLESYVAYSLCRPYSAARFYIMQWSQSFSIKKQVPLKFLVESLQGPLAENSYGSWATTTVVEFYHMLPYFGFISHWLSGKNLNAPCLIDCNAQSTMSNSEKEISEINIPAFPDFKCNEDNSDHVNDNGNSTKDNSFEMLNCIMKKFKHASGEKAKTPLDVSQQPAEEGGVGKKFKKKGEIVDSVKNLVGRGNIEIVQNNNGDNKALLSGPSGELYQRTEIKDKVNKRIKICELADSDGSKEIKINHESLNGDSDKSLEGFLSGSSREQQITTSSELTTCQKSDDSYWHLESKSGVYHRRKKMSTQQHSRGSVDNVILNDVNANVPFYIKNIKINENVTRENDVGSELCLQNEVAMAQNQQVQVVAKTKCNAYMQNEVAMTQNQQVQVVAKTNCSAYMQNLQSSEDLKNALSLLYRKRREMCSEIHSMEDALALSEDYIERIRDGGDVGLARLCIKSIINGNYPMLLNHEILIHGKDHHPGNDHCVFPGDKQIRSSDTHLPGKSSCQDLEYICLKNNWRLPRYFVEPSDGKFLSKVVVKSNDFKLSLKGSLKSNASEARESAAVHVIARLSDTEK